LSRKHAFQFPEVRVVEASAGSGKTFALAKRYVQLVLAAHPSHNDLPIRTILAITFMKKASFEMKQRILAFLKGIALKTMTKDELGEILDPIGLDLNTASARAFQVMDGLIHQYNFFQVQTIDAFINALLSGCAFKIGLSSRFRIKHNPFDYLSYSLDRLIEHAAHDPKVRNLFADFLNQYLLLENKTNWFPKKDILGMLFTLYGLRNSYGLNFEPGGMDEGKLTGMMGRVVDLITRFKDNLPEGIDGRAVRAGTLAGFLEKYKTAFRFDEVPGCFAKPEIPLKKGADCPADIRQLWREIRESLRAIAEYEAITLFDPYVAIFNTMIKEFDAKAVEDDILFMEELSRKARRLFDECGVTVEELYYRLATRFRHYMIDEFQDTNKLHWKNVEMMIEEALSTGGSLFYVGDKKQAIYGFRGGDARLFDRVREQFRHFNVREEYLTKNWRSCQAIVEFNNQIFSLENLRRFISEKEAMEENKKRGVKECERVELETEDYERFDAVFGHARQSFQSGKTGGYVRVRHVSGKTKEIRNDELKQQVKTLLRDLEKRYPWREIAVLMRTNKEVEEVTAWLMEEGIPVESDRTLDITANTLVQELVAFLRFLNSPIDDLAFARVILGEVFQSAAGLDSGDMHAFLFELRKAKDKEKRPALYREFRKRYPQVWDAHIAPFFRSAGLYPLYETLVSVLREWEVLEHFQDQCGFVMQLLEIIKRREEEGCDLIMFLEYFERIQNEDKFVNVADVNAVRLLTMHKAKGLEFPVVILPFASMKIKNFEGGGNSEEGLGQISYVLDSQDEFLRLMRIKMAYLGYSDLLYQIYRHQHVESLISELNNIYVALTRAKKEVYLFIPERVGQSENLIGLLIPEGVTEIGAPFEHPPGEAEKTPMVVLPVSEYRDWIGYLNEEFMAERDALLNREKIRRGKELHEVLALVGTTDNKLLGVDSSEKIKFLEELFSKKKLGFLFDPNAGIFTEKEIVDAEGRTKRIDRLIVKEDEVSVVDYKSGRIADDHYHQQVKGYMDAVGEMYPGRAVRGFLLYLESLELEEVQ